GSPPHAYLYDADTGRLRRRHPLDKGTNGIREVSVDAAGRTLALSDGSGAPAVRVYDLGSGKLVRLLTVGASAARLTALSPDGKAVLLRDATTGGDVLPFDAHASPVYRLAPGAGGRVLVSGDRGAVLAWDWRSGRLLRRFPAEGADGERALAALADGGVLVAD